MLSKSIVDATRQPLALWMTRSTIILASASIRGHDADYKCGYEIASKFVRSIGNLDSQQTSEESRNQLCSYAQQAVGDTPGAGIQFVLFHRNEDRCFVFGCGTFSALKLKDNQYIELIEPHSVYQNLLSVGAEADVLTRRIPTCELCSESSGQDIREASLPSGVSSQIVFVADPVLAYAISSQSVDYDDLLSFAKTYSIPGLQINKTIIAI